MIDEDNFCTEENTKAELYNNMLLEGMNPKEAGDFVNSEFTQAIIKCHVDLTNHWKAHLEEFCKSFEVAKDEH
ncbi:hypothetical protein NVP1063O_187 [Vibrio phage 1.063.O._10N.261.45.C7]|nr:hypothetical protein NVP1063O_187 [Vibrio phage 1.063.O._10N.261.45.C7]